MSPIEAELRALYADASKHSAYQSIPGFVSDALGYRVDVDQGWRGDHPRLRYLVHRRPPRAGEHWGDFGANTGFFTLTLARENPDTRFTAIEANANHARFIQRIVDYFGMSNVRVLSQSIGFSQLHTLQSLDFLLHLNVLHHAGHDFDANLVKSREAFGTYAVNYLSALRQRAASMVFQLGSNWGGDKDQPLVGVRDDGPKLELFSTWLKRSGWDIGEVAYATRDDANAITYEALDLPRTLNPSTAAMSIGKLQGQLDRFPGEFYRRPLFLCVHSS
jgi:hypothetical protein